MKLILKLILTFNIVLIGFINHLQTLEANTAPTIQLSSTSVQQGGRARIIVQSRNVNDLAGFQIQIFYNDEVMNVAQTYTYPYTSSRGSSTLNTSEEGVISISFVGTTPLSGSANLFYIEFDISSIATVQNYPLLVAVQEAIDSELRPMSLESANGQIDVQERTTSPRNVPISTSVNRSRMEMGETFTFSLNLNHSILKSAGSFDILYDDEIFKLTQTTVGSLPSQSQSFTTVNDQFRGRVHLNFISLNGLNSVWPLVTLEFEVIKDIQAHTNIEVIPIQVLDMDLQPLQVNASTRSVQISKKPPTFNVPSVIVESKTLTTIDDFYVDLKVEAQANLAIGVFEVRYNPYLLDFSEIEMLNENEIPNVLSLYTHEKEEGLLKITYINPQGLTTAESIARIHFSPLQNETPINTEIKLENSQLLNANYQVINLAAKDAQVHLSNRFQVKIFHDDQLIQEQTTENLNAINYPIVELDEGERFGFWEPTIQGQTISYQSRVYRLGDLNEDGMTDAEDLLILRNALVGKTNLSRLQIRAANLMEREIIDQQSELSLKDVVLLQLKMQEETEPNMD